MRNTKRSKKIINYSKKTRKYKEVKNNCENITTYEIKRIRNLTKNVRKKNSELLKNKIK